MRLMQRRWFLRLIHYPPRLAYRLGLGPWLGRTVLLLTTIGRRSGRPRTTPLQYETIDGLLYVAAAQGTRADWFRNLVANPLVAVQVGNRRSMALAEPLTNPAQIANFLEVRLKRHPRMMGALLRAEGLPLPPTREDLEQFAAGLALVALRPAQNVPPAP